MALSPASSSPRLREERILLSSLNDESVLPRPQQQQRYNGSQELETEIKMKDTFDDDNLSNSKMIKSPKLFFFKANEKPPEKEPEANPIYEEDERVVRIAPRSAAVRIASPTIPKRFAEVVTSPTSEAKTQASSPFELSTETAKETFDVSSDLNVAKGEDLKDDKEQRIPQPPQVQQVFRRKASAREQGKWKHEEDQKGGNAVPEGSGYGTIIAYARRSAEDRSAKPLHSQFETIIGYVNECILSKASPRTRGYGIRKFFVDNGISGSVELEKRPGLSALMEEVKALSNDGVCRSSSIHVVTYDAYRIARALAVGAQFKRFLERAGATLHLAQSRMIVEGANAELFFGLNLQIASSERTLTITRVKNAFAHHPDWDPRKSFGWRFIGPGIPPEKIPEEQAILEKMKKMFEEDGLQVKEIAKIIQEETGGRRLRRIPPSSSGGASTVSIETGEEKKEMWTGTEITFLAKKHKWKWGGGLSLKDLEKEAEIAKREGKDLEVFLKEKKGTRYDGVKINRAMLKRFFTEAQPKWKAIAIERVRVWIRQEKHSVDDIANMLKDEVERPGKEGWPRQTVWRLIKHCEELEKRAKMTF